MVIFTPQKVCDTVKSILHFNPPWFGSYVQASRQIISGDPNYYYLWHTLLIKTNKHTTTKSNNNKRRHNCETGYCFNGILFGTLVTMAFTFVDNSPKSEVKPLHMKVLSLRVFSTIFVFCAVFLLFSAFHYFLFLKKVVSYWLYYAKVFLFHTIFLGKIKMRYFKRVYHGMSNLKLIS